MSLIHGILQCDGQPVAENALHPLLAAGQASCPDGSGQWRDGQIALGCNLMQTLPAHRCETAPLRDAASGLVVVADARLDNRAELVCQLGLGTEAAYSDAALILHAYRAWGKDCAGRLLGDFAFAVWDVVRRKLFCARDIFGIRPFHYCHDGQTFIFSSAVHALLQVPAIPHTLNDEFIADYLAGLAWDSNATVYRAIATLPAAHYMTVQDGKVVQASYWSPQDAPYVSFPRDEDYVERFRELFTESVRCRLETDGKAASLLSGGLDSSAIAAVAGRMLAAQGRQLDTYSFVLAEHQRPRNSDEKEFIDELHRMPGLDGHFISPDDFVGLSADECFGVCAHLPLPRTPYLQALFGQLRKRRTRVLFDGVGGDQCATCESPPLLRELLAGGPGRLLRYVRAAHGHNGHRWPGIVKGLLARQLGRGGSLDIKDIVLFRSLLSQGLRERTHMLQRARRNVRFQAASRQDLRQVMQQRLSLMERGFRYTEVFGQAGVEVRYPMLDRRLVEYSLGVPAEQHNYEMNRRLVRRAMAGLVPDAVRLRNSKFGCNQPGGADALFAQRGYFLAQLAVAESVPWLADYVDLARLKQRFEKTAPLPGLQEQLRFMPGPTLTAFAVLQFLLQQADVCGTQS